jgi:hypothetical protein
LALLILLAISREIHTGDMAAYGSFEQVTADPAWMIKFIVTG